MNIDLPESRLNKIFLSIIDSRDKFMKYLTFLLTGEESEIIWDSDKSNALNEQKNEHGVPFFDGIPLFEKMLISCSRYPDKLKSIDRLIDRIKSESESNGQNGKIVTDEFVSFWNIFRDYLSIKN